MWTSSHCGHSPALKPLTLRSPSFCGLSVYLDKKQSLVFLCDSSAFRICLPELKVAFDAHMGFRTITQKSWRHTLNVKCPPLPWAHMLVTSWCTDLEGSGTISRIVELHWRKSVEESGTWDSIVLPQFFKSSASCLHIRFGQPGLTLSDGLYTSLSCRAKPTRPVLSCFLSDILS